MLKNRHDLQEMLKTQTVYRGKLNLNRIKAEYGYTKMPKDAVLTLNPKAMWVSLDGFLYVRMEN